MPTNNTIWELTMTLPNIVKDKTTYHVSRKDAEFAAVSALKDYADFQHEFRTPSSSLELVSQDFRKHSIPFQFKITKFQSAGVKAESPRFSIPLRQTRTIGEEVETVDILSMSTEEYLDWAKDGSIRWENYRNDNVQVCNQTQYCSFTGQSRVSNARISKWKHRHIARYLENLQDLLKGYQEWGKKNDVEVSMSILIGNNIECRFRFSGEYAEQNCVIANLYHDTKKGMVMRFNSGLRSVEHYPYRGRKLDIHSLVQCKISEWTIDFGGVQ